MMRKKEKKKLRIKERTNEVIQAYLSTGTQTDPMGQYTGVTGEVRDAMSQATPEGKIYINPAAAASNPDMPVQDADDL